MKCTECGHELIKTDLPFREEINGEKYIVRGIERFECPICGEYELSLEMADKLNERLWEQYRKAHAILSPQEIKSIRKRLGVSQQQLEKMLKVSHPTVSRWETGMFAPSAQTSREIEALRDCFNFANYLMSKAEVHPKSRNSYQKKLEFPLCDRYKRSQKTAKQPNFVLD